MDTFLIRLNKTSSSDSLKSILFAVEQIGGTVYEVLSDGTAILCLLDGSKVDCIQNLPSVLLVGEVFINKSKLSKRKRLLKL